MNYVKIKLESYKNKQIKYLDYKIRGMLATHLLTYTFQHTPFDWLKFIGSHQIMWVLYTFCGSHVNFNQSKRVCWKVCIASISHKIIVDMYYLLRCLCR